MVSIHNVSLPTDILLFIFLYLDSYQLVICRRVSKQFLEVIDNNRLLWRIFEWNQQDRESLVPALDMFDEHSHSSLESVSIQEHFNENSEDLLHLMQILNRSKKTLKEVTLNVSYPSLIEDKAVKLMSAGSNLRRMVLWFWGLSKVYQDVLPVSRLVFSSLRDQSSPVGQVQVLWAFYGIRTIDSKHLKSLVSFAQYDAIGYREFRELTSNFSETIVHLSIRICHGPLISNPISCPNLKVFEGWVLGGFSSFFDAPRLQIIFLKDIGRFELKGIPSSVEEIWLRIDAQHPFLDAEAWEQLLLHSCPKLKILKLFKHSSSADRQRFTIKGLLEALDIRNQRARHGNEIDGIKMVSLQRLVLRTDLFRKEESDRAAKAVREVIDIKNYPKFIEIKC